ncbi:hypothetical protein J1614_005419, partial [Plenodomus biglobosus]
VPTYHAHHISYVYLTHIAPQQPNSRNSTDIQWKITWEYTFRRDNLFEALEAEGADAFLVSANAQHLRKYLVARLLQITTKGPNHVSSFEEQWTSYTTLYLSGIWGDTLPSSLMVDKEETRDCIQRELGSNRLLVVSPGEEVEPIRQYLCLMLATREPESSRTALMLLVGLLYPLFIIVLTHSPSTKTKQLRRSLSTSCGRRDNSTDDTAALVNVAVRSVIHSPGYRKYFTHCLDHRIGIKSTRVHVPTKGAPEQYISLAWYSLQSPAFTFPTT